jgi:hypothetical protein
MPQNADCLLYLLKGETEMKKFEEPKLNIEELKVEDVLTTSTCDADNCPNLGGCAIDE